MRRLGLILLLGLLAGCGKTAAQSQADDLRAWQGTWKLVKYIEAGESQTADMQWVVSGDHYNIRTEGHTGSDPYTITLDAEHKHIDVFHHDTPAGTYGGRYKGIYDLQGDSLRVCYDLTAQRYPASFDAPPGSRRAVFQFQRQ